VGEAFSIHVVSNPDFDSELALLVAYAPNTDPDVLATLCRCFAELRQLADEVGSYPFFAV
jgi:hypothetical protein